jgi:hypothetical protein
MTMGFSKARESNLHHEEKGEDRPIVLIDPAAFRETAYRRWRRQASTLARAVHAGRARAKSGPGRDVLSAGPSRPQILARSRLAGRARQPPAAQIDRYGAAWTAHAGPQTVDQIGGSARVLPGPFPFTQRDVICRPRPRFGTA